MKDVSGVKHLAGTGVIVDLIEGTSVCWWSSFAEWSEGVAQRERVGES